MEEPPSDSSLGASDETAESQSRRPHIVLVVPRGEAVRNFVSSETLPRLAKQARVTLLSVVQDSSLLGSNRDYADQILPLNHYRPPTWVSRLRTLTENAHDRWLWSEVAKNNWELRDRRAAEQSRRIQRAFVKASSKMLGTRPILRKLTRAEQRLSLRSPGAGELRDLFERIQPDLVFNGSHIHGIAGELPVKVAADLGIPTAGFIFSWDNLTSRTRIFAPYDYWFVWHEGMKRQLLEIYPEIPADQVVVTGTPQFDFHFDPRFNLGREELCEQIGIDPERSFVLYTTGISNHFYEEHHHVRRVANLLQDLNLEMRPQLVVRTYVKGTSPEMKRLAQEGLPETVFPEVQWEPKWQTPKPEDYPIYSSLLRHCALGINAASTVSLELMIFDKPIINLDYEPPESDLPWCMGYQRHIRFDHYRPVAESGAVMLARSNEEMREMLQIGMTQPALGSERRRAFLKGVFGDLLDGNSGRRIAEQLTVIAQ